jgi:hypothetical protein
MNSQGDHQAESLEQATQPSLCANGCGFFANPTHNNLCSKCFAEEKMAVERKASAQAAFSDVHKPAPPALPLPVAPASVSTPEASQPVPEAAASSGAPATGVDKTTDEMFQRPVQLRPGRCMTCNKKVGLAGFKCRCEYVFCGAHRLAEAHNCDFDYKTVGRQQLAESNPLIQAAKMDKL